MSVYTLGKDFEQWISNELWDDMGISVIEKYSEKLDQRKHGDFRIKLTDGTIRNVDVKAENNTPPNFPIELSQDWTSNDIGWYYTLFGCDEIWYGRYKDNTIESVYRISMSRLRKVSRSVSKTWQVKKASKN